MPLMGVDKLYVSKQLTDTAAGMTFSSPQYYPNVQTIDVKPKVNSAQAYAENRLIDQATLFDSAEISISRYSMSSAERSFLLGQALPSTGGSVSSDCDVAPYIAALYKAPIKVGNAIGARYGIIYKTMFTPPDESFKGLEGKPDLSEVATIAGSAQPTEWSFIDVDGSTKHPWEYHIDTFDPGCPANIDSIFFNSVMIPSISAILALIVSSVPANAATGVALATKPVLTFNNIIANYGGTVLLDETDNTIVANTLSLDITSKNLTISPLANLVVGKTYDIILTGVTDIYGQILAQQVIKFTT